MTQTPWSYSRIANYEDCPHKFYRLSVLKDVKEVDSPASLEGQKWHDALAKRIKTGERLPLQMRWMEPLMEKLMAAPGDKLAEEKLALNSKLQPTGWMAPDVWVRSIFDFTIDHNDTAIIIDWKTGKEISTDFTQQRIAGAVLMCFTKELKTVKLGYYWTQHRKMTMQTITRKDIRPIFEDLKPRIARYQAAHDTKMFPPRPTDKCRWCPIADCKFNANRKLK